MKRLKPWHKYGMTEKEWLVQRFICAVVAKEITDVRPLRLLNNRDKLKAFARMQKRLQLRKDVRAVEQVQHIWSWNY